MPTPPDEAGDSTAKASGKKVRFQPPDNCATVQGHQEPLPLESLPQSVRSRIIGTHRANPHVYDYLHEIQLNADHSAELADGGGQCINSIARGQWMLTKSSNPEKYTLHIINPEEVYRNLGDSSAYRSFSVDFKIVTKQKTVVVQSGGKGGKGRPVPTLTCFSKLVFDRDPLKLIHGDDDRPGPFNLFDVLEKDRKFLAAERKFYAMDDAVNGHQ